MTFQPIVPLPGIAGWEFLQRTYDRQYESFLKAPELQRDIIYFRENIANVSSVSDLISDRQLLSIALGAFGLSEDIDNRAFIQRILEDGTTSRDALANRLADDRYKSFSSAFGFGPNQTIQTSVDGFSERILARYEAEKFEKAVGQQDESMRIALYGQRELQELSKSGKSKEVQWLSIMGQPPLRKMMETAFGLPSSFGQLNIDKQLSSFQEKSRLKLGTDDLGEIVAPERLKTLTNLYLAHAQIDVFKETVSSASVAITLLSLAQTG